MRSIDNKKHKSLRAGWMVYPDCNDRSAANQGGGHRFDGRVCHISPDGCTGSRIAPKSSGNFPERSPVRLHIEPASAYMVPQEITSYELGIKC